MKRLFNALIPAGLAAAAIAVSPLAASAQSLETDYNYVGGGVSVGELGGTSDVGLAINSKFRVYDHVSVRPSIASDLNFDGNGATQFTLPVTYDFNALTSDGRLLPFVGAGAAYTTAGDDDFGALVTAGVDYRLTDRLTANGTVNVNFFDNTQVNGVIGLGYTF
ncbi:MAG: hypothetical protein AAGF66_10725 [Cyanobacteria bacterium P01_H01_bin.119]